MTETTAREVVLLSRLNGCEQCKTVKRVFKTLGVHFREIDVDTEALKAAPYLNKATARSLPLMFVGEKNVAAGLQCIEEVRNYAN